MGQSNQQRERNPFWEKLAWIATVLSVVFAVFSHFDAKRSAENKIVEVLSERYEIVDREMSYEQALAAVDREIVRLQNDNSMLQSNNINLQEKANSYEQALAVADKDIVTLQNNNSILETNNIDLKQKVNELQSEVDSLQNESERSEKIALAESYATSGKYDVAIPVLNSVSQKDGEVVALLKDYTVIYENLIVTNAEALANDGKFDEAVTLIDEALKILPNSQELIDKKKNVTPQYLVDVIECFKANNLRLLDNKEYIKMSGKSYRHAIHSEQSDPVWSMFNSAYSANASYNLDGKYSQLSGIVGHVDFSGSGTISKNDAGQVYDAEVVIWGDGKEIKTITLLADDVTKDFNVSVVGVQILEFQIECNGNSKVGIAEIQIR